MKISSGFIQKNFIKRWLRLAILPITALAMTSLSACAAAIDTPAAPKVNEPIFASMPTRTTKELVAMVKKPTTQVMLLQNIKFALDSHLLLNEDFYKEEYLKQFFGDAQLDFRGSNEQTKMGSLVNYRKKAVPDKFGDGEVSGAYINFLRQIKDDGKVVGSLQVSISKDVRPMFQDVEILFGKRWYYAEYHNPEIKGLGIVYEMNDAQGHRKIRLSFDADGSDAPLSSFLCSDETK